MYQLLQVSNQNSLTHPRKTSGAKRPVPLEVHTKTYKNVLIPVADPEGGPKAKAAPLILLIQIFKRWNPKLFKSLEP